MTLRSLLIAAALLWASPAAGQSGKACALHGDVIRNFAAVHGEAPVAIGVTANGWVLEVLASDGGSWTIIVTLPNGISCGIATGEGWESIETVKGKVL